MVNRLFHVCLFWSSGSLLILWVLEYSMEYSLYLTSVSLEQLEIITELTDKNLD